MPKDVAARKQIQEFKGALAAMAKANVNMSALMVKCARGFQLLIDKGLITNEEIEAGISETDSADPIELQVQSEDSGTDESNS